MAFDRASAYGMARVVLITGPAGSGKSTLAEYLAEKLGWRFLSEDEYWIENGWGSGLRAPHQEAEIQRQVFADVLFATRAGTNVVLEFILHREPPDSPLMAYQEMLSAHAVDVRAIVLRPSVDEILRRIVQRGRPNDLDTMATKREMAEHQLRVSGAEFVGQSQVIDPTNMTFEALFRECVGRLGLGDESIRCDGRSRTS